MAGETLTEDEEREIERHVTRWASAGADPDCDCPSCIVSRDFPRLLAALRAERTRAERAEALAKAERAYRLADRAYMLACVDGRPRDAHAAKVAETEADLRAAGGAP
jgi:hypothetical protein